MVLGLGIAATWAAPANVVVNDDHSVSGRVEVAATPAVLKEKLQDPTWVAGIDGGGTTVTIEKRDGDCLVAENISPSAIKRVQYRVRQCPTATGYVSTLVDSNTFDAYHVEWIIEPVEGGARLRYELKTATSLMVPQFIIDNSTRKGVLNLLSKLQGHFGAL